MTRRKKELGANGEEIAVRYLKGRGYMILERNYRTRLGEIDIVARHGPDLVFVEVKTRSDSAFGSPLESVTIPKQKQLSKVALEYMSRCGAENRPARFDVVGVMVNGADATPGQKATVELIQNAFDLSYGTGE
jgi:putative endonuclease